MGSSIFSPWPLLQFGPCYCLVLTNLPLILATIFLFSFFFFWRGVLAIFSLFSSMLFFPFFFLQRPSLYTTQKCRSGVFELTCIRHKSEKQRKTQITVMNLAKKLSGSGNDRISKIFGPGKTGNPIAKLVSQLIQFWSQVVRFAERVIRYRNCIDSENATDAN